MKRIANFIEIMSDMGSGQVAGWLGIFLMGMVLVEVVTRYIFRSPLTIADELGGYTLVAIVFIGLAYTWKSKGHVCIEVVISRLPTKVRKWLRLATLIMATAFVPWLIWASCELVIYSSNFGMRSGDTLRTPLMWPQMVLIIGGVFLLFQLILDLIRAVRTVRTSKGESR